TLLNDEAFFECAQAFAGRVLRECKAGDEERLAHAFRLALVRSPKQQEREVLARLLERQRAALEKDPQEARGLAGTSLPTGADVTEYAAWTAVAGVLLTLDEFITRE